MLPLYFTGGDEYEGRNDFLGTVQNGKTLRSFGVNPGGYVSYVDPQTRKTGFYFNHGDNAAKNRIALKTQIKGASRLVRYQRITDPTIQDLAKHQKRKKGRKKKNSN